MPAGRRSRLEPPALFLQGMKGEREEKGFFVTHVVRRDADGVPLMKYSDKAKVEACMAERRCQACGFAIGSKDWICFVGASDDRDFAEPPLHLICANYSLGTCPHLLKQTRLESIQLVLCKKYEYLGITPLAGSEELEPQCRPLPLSADEAEEVARQLPYSDLGGALLRLAPGQLRDWVSRTAPSEEAQHEAH